MPHVGKPPADLHRLQLGMGGYSWDKETGGKAPTDAALLSGANWDQFATSDKDTLGVAVETN